MARTAAANYVVEQLKQHGASLFEPVVGADPVAWIVPSSVFERFAESTPGAGRCLLNLDKDDMGEPLSERLRVYRGRWTLIADYAKYRSTLSDPVSLQMRLAMG
jgi:hypothetical protein